MKIIGFAAKGVSNFDERKHRSLIADNHFDGINAHSIAEAVDSVVSQLDHLQDGENWVDLVKKSPYFISRNHA